MGAAYIKAESLDVGASEARHSMLPCATLSEIYDQQGAKDPGSSMSRVLKTCVVNTEDFADAAMWDKVRSQRQTWAYRCTVVPWYRSLFKGQSVGDNDVLFCVLRYPEQYNTDSCTHFNTNVCITLPIPDEMLAPCLDTPKSTPLTNSCTLQHRLLHTHPGISHPLSRCRTRSWSL